MSDQITIDEGQEPQFGNGAGTSGAEAAAPNPKALKKQAAGGFQDKKKVIIMLALLAVGGVVVAIQFLGGGGPKEAEAKSTGPDATNPSAVTNKELEQVLARLRTGGNENNLSVARVESLVEEFDQYVPRRQVPLEELAVNPFSIRLAPEQMPKVEGPTEAEVRARIAKQRAEQEARQQRIIEAGRKLDLASVALWGETRTAMINDHLCTIGDTVGGFEVTGISDRGVELVCDDITFELNLYDDSGGT